MNSLTIGKLRGLQQCSTPHGVIALLAVDHRNNLRKTLHPEKPESTTADDMVAFKTKVVKYIAPAASAVLLDPEVGGAQCIATGALPGSTGLVMAIEATGYTGDPTARRSGILPGWSVAKAKRMGAGAIKLLVYYHPDAPVAADIEALVQQVATDCSRADIPLFLEPLSYTLNPDGQPPKADDKKRIVIETARRLTPLGVDVLKAEFPLDIGAYPDTSLWADACAELSQASAVPWILLSAAVDFETYLKQVTVACQQGASGVAVGRAVWKEAVTLKASAQERFLYRTAHTRMNRLANVCNALASPWTNFYTAPTVDETWYQSYVA